VLVGDDEAVLVDMTPVPSMSLAPFRGVRTMTMAFLEFVALWTTAVSRERVTSLILRASFWAVETDLPAAWSWPDIGLIMEVSCSSAATGTAPGAIPRPTTTKTATAVSPPPATPEAT
jgi:hypothetical protein